MLISVLLLAAVVQAPAATVPADSEKKVCKRMPEVTGSNMPRRECKTRSEWAAIAKANAKETDAYVRNRRLGGNVPAQN